MTAAAIQPIVYGRDASGAPAAIDPAGAGPHVLITGGAGRGLTTLAGVIAAGAARNGGAVSSCHPRDDDDWTSGLPGITAGRGLEETIRLIDEARDGMNRRLVEVSRGADPAGYPHALLAIDDYQDLAAAPAPSGGGPAVTALADIAVLGRAVRVTLVLATHVLYAVPGLDLANFGTRITLGPVPRATALRLFGEADRRWIPAAPGSGTAVTGDGPPTAIRVASPHEVGR